MSELNEFSLKVASVLEKYAESAPSFAVEIPFELSLVKMAEAMQEKRADPFTAASVLPLLGSALSTGAGWVGQALPWLGGAALATKGYQGLKGLEKMHALNVAGNLGKKEMKAFLKSNPGMQKEIATQAGKMVPEAAGFQKLEQKLLKREKQLAKLKKGKAWYKDPLTVGLGTAAGVGFLPHILGSDSNQPVIYKY